MPTATLNDSARNLLGKPVFAVVATINKDGTPQQTVLWFELQDDRIVMNTAAGRLKEKNLQRDPRISFCLADGYEYLTIKAHAQLEYDREKTQADVRKLATRYEGEEVAERMMQNVFSKQDRVTISIPLNRMDSVLYGVSGVRKEVTGK